MSHKYDNYKIGIWLLIINDLIEMEFDNEKEAINQFEIATCKGSDTYGSEVQLVRVLRTTKLNEYNNLSTTGDWKLSPTVEGS